MSNLASNLQLAPTITKVSLTFVNLIDPISTTVPIRLPVTILVAYISVDSTDATPLSVTNADEVTITLLVGVAIRADFDIYRWLYLVELTKML